jgi:monoamine oxidase
VTEVDVVVVGAGYAGLTAARRLVQAGRRVLVLEARDRVGGRIWTEPLADGTPIDRGGAWLAPRHDAMFGLAEELGVKTYKTYVAGRHLLAAGGKLRRYTGLIPKISPLAVLQIAWTQWKVDRLARQVPLDEPWAAPHAAEWDSWSVAWYLANKVRIRSKVGFDLFETAVSGLMTGDLNEVSFLHLLWLVRGHHSLNVLFSIEKGSQENMIEGGAGTIAQRMAAALGDDVRLDSSVTAITQHPDHVEVATAADTITAGHVIVATPPALTLDITFTPPLDDDRVALYRESVGGPEAKTSVVYATPFWRAAGFSGQTASPGTIAEVTIDASPMDASRGILACFSFSATAERFAALDANARRTAMLDALVDRLGPEAADPLAFVETFWWQDHWTQGCSFAHLSPGVLTAFGPLIRRPYGRVHWAGTETSGASHGAMDGAVRSGERAAREVIAAT